MQVLYDNGSGTPVDITQHVQTINDIDVENITEETHPFGTAWEESKGVGIGRMAPVELGGLYDDVADGPDDMFGDRIPEGPNATTRTLTFVWIPGSPSKSTSVETILALYKRTPDRAAITKWMARLQPTGTVTET